MLTVLTPTLHYVSYSNKLTVAEVRIAPLSICGSKGGDISQVLYSFPLADSPGVTRQDVCSWTILESIETLQC